MRLEVIPEREVAQHLEERVVAGGVPNLLEIVVLATCAYAFLRGRRPPTKRRVLQTEENLLELHHSRVGKEQCRIVGGNERAARTDGVSVALEILEESTANLG